MTGLLHETTCSQPLSVAASSPEWVHRADRPSWHPDDCNLDCCWVMAD